jgi:hypothetical protein
LTPLGKLVWAGPSTARGPPRQSFTPNFYSSHPRLQGMLQQQGCIFELPLEDPIDSAPCKRLTCYCSIKILSIHRGLRGYYFSVCLCERFFISDIPHVAGVILRSELCQNIGRRPDKCWLIRTYTTRHSFSTQCTHINGSISLESIHPSNICFILLVESDVRDWRMDLTPLVGAFVSCHELSSSDFSHTTSHERCMSR